MSANILLVSYVFPPSAGAGVQRISKLAEYLIFKGYFVSVLTHDDHDLLQDNGLLGDVLVDVNVLCVPFFDHSDPGDDSLSLDVKRFVEKQRPEIIISSSPTIEAHFLAKKIRGICSASWIADFRDIPSEYTSWINYISCREITKTERDIVNSSDSVVVISDYHKNYVSKRYNTHEDKITVVMNGYDASDFNDKNNDKNESTLFESKLTLVHVGTFYGKRSPLMLIINALIAQRKSGIKLKLQLVGKMGRISQFIVNLFQKVISIEVVGQVSHSKAIQIMHQADVLVLVPGRFGVGVITGKVFEYVASGRPVINLFSYAGPLTEILEGVDGVFNVHEVNFKKFSEVIRVIADEDLPHHYHRSDFQKYERNNQYKVLESMMLTLGK